MRSRYLWGMGMFLLCSLVVIPAGPVLAQAKNAAVSPEKALAASQKHLEKARAYREKGKSEPAAAEYRNSIAASPAMVEAYLELGELYSQANSHEKAVEMLDIGISMALLQEIVHPDIGRYCCILAKNHQALGRTDLASGDLVKAQKYLPDDPLPLIVLGDIQTARGRFDAAIGAYRRALDLDRENVDGWWGLGTTAVRAGLQDAAQEAHRNLSNLDQARASALANLMKSASTAGQGNDSARP